MTSSTNFPGPVKVQGRYVPTLSTDNSSLVDGDGIAIPPTNVSVNSRDGMGRATSYTVAGTIFTVTYGANGVSTVSGGGKITTFTYNASGLLTSVATA